MKTCHVCNAECEDSAELCKVCGADLTEPTEENEATVENVTVISNPVLVATLEDVVSAEIFKDILKENGIPFSMDDIQDGTMKVTFGGSFVADDIYVSDSDYERAAALYEDFMNSEPEFDETFFDEEFEDGAQV